ncbi:SDR family NAD(P)-dependent oxidoreductase [Spongisporangium articulatum]|uniref:SDR family NAD(P)-dependent oxidoreductase n=1 Tax=Spongisporangium articulatum TaxID=3362603 RepID=A0ABW8AHT0_9ACTN
MSLTSQTVVVTGASRGIGAAAARALHARGATVALLGRDKAALADVTAELGSRAAWFVADVTDSESTAAAAKQVLDRFGQVDSLVVNAGLNLPGTVRSPAADQTFATIIETNLIGSYRTLHAFWPALEASKGYILLMSSIASSVGLGGQTAYAASKAGIESMAHTLRMETAHLGVTIGAVHPWFADTALLHTGEAAMPTFAQTRKRLAPFGRIPGPVGLIGLTLSPEEIGEVMADMVEKRARKRHVPRSSGWMNTGRPVLNSGYGEFVQQAIFGWMMKRIDKETR